MPALIIRNLSDQLVEVVRNRVLSGQVDPFLPIRQDALAAELGVSKIPLREALGRLEQEGLLRSQANRGFFVQPLTMEEAEEVYALRLKLEPEAVALAATLATEKQRHEASDALAKLDGATGQHIYTVGTLNRLFHIALVRPSMQELTTNILQRLHVLSERYVRKHLEPIGRDRRSIDEHSELFQAWLDRDSESVRAQMHIHIAQTLEDLRRQPFDAGNESPERPTAFVPA